MPAGQAQMQPVCAAHCLNSAALAAMEAAQLVFGAQRPDFTP
jgi:hypothetical protein